MNVAIAHPWEDWIEIVSAPQTGRDRFPYGSFPNPTSPSSPSSRTQSPVSWATPCVAVRRQPGPVSPVLIQKPSLGRQGVCAC